MSWEAVGAIGEVSGAIATLVMLIYLSIQVRHARDATQSSSELEAAKLLTQLNQGVAQDRDLMRIWELVLEESNELSKEEKIHYLWSVAAYATATEGVFQQYQKGMISEEVWGNWERGFTMHMGTRVGFAWWSSRSAPFSEPFYRHISSIIENKKNPMPIPAKNFLTDTKNTGNSVSSENDT